MPHFSFEINIFLSKDDNIWSVLADTPPTTKEERYASPFWNPYRLCARRKVAGNLAQDSQQ